MNNFYRCAFILVLSFFIWTSGLQAEEKQSAKEQAKETSISDSNIQTLPVKPSEKIIKQQLSFNSWIDQGFEELNKKIPYSKVRELRKICLKEGGLFEATVRDGRTLEDLDYLIVKLESMQNEEDNSYINVFIETFLPLVKEMRQNVHNFLTNSTIYENLQEDIKPDDMVGHWFWYGYMYAHDPNKVSPLFTREFRKKIYANQFSLKGDGEDEFENIYEFLEEILEIYYDAGIKLAKLQVYQEFGIKDSENQAIKYKLMSRAFNVIKNGYGSLIIQQDQQTRTIQDDTEEITIIWKWTLEDGAWRFNGLYSDISDSKNQ